MVESDQRGPRQDSSRPRSLIAIGARQFDPEPGRVRRAGRTDHRRSSTSPSAAREAAPGEGVASPRLRRLPRGNVAADMTTSAIADSQSLDIEPPRFDSLEWRASVALKVLAFINVAGVVLAMFPPPLPASLLHGVTFNLAAGLLAGLEIVAARALDHRRPWAVALVRPLLAVLIAEGIGAMLVGLDAGRIRVPFEAFIAIWVLLAGADLTLIRRADRRSVSLVALTSILIVSMLAGEPVFGWGGLLDVRQSDLRASIAADCEPGTGLPPTLTVTYDWSWARTSPLPNGLDIVVIGWSGSDAAGRTIYLFDKDPDPGHGIHSGRRGYPSLDMATLVGKETRASWSWGVELGEQGLQPGHIELQMRRARDAPPEPSPLVITATYIHLGIWRSDPVSVTCSW